MEKHLFEKRSRALGGLLRNRSVLRVGVKEIKCLKVTYTQKWYPVPKMSPARLRAALSPSCFDDDKEDKKIVEQVTVEGQKKVTFEEQQKVENTKGVSCKQESIKEDTDSSTTETSSSTSDTSSSSSSSSSSSDTSSSSSGTSSSSSSDSSSSSSDSSDDEATGMTITLEAEQVAPQMLSRSHDYIVDMLRRNIAAKKQAETDVKPTLVPVSLFGKPYEMSEAEIRYLEERSKGTQRDQKIIKQTPGEYKRNMVEIRQQRRQDWEQRRQRREKKREQFRQERESLEQAQKESNMKAAANVVIKPEIITEIKALEDEDTLEEEEAMTE